MKNLRINKRLLASVLSFTLFTSSLVGCSSESPEMFDYKTNEDGTIECLGKIDHIWLSGYEVVGLTIFGKTEFYIAKKHKRHSEFSYEQYYSNIINKQRIYSSKDVNENKKIQILGTVEDYLLYYDMVKGSYSIEDLENLLSKIKEDKELEKDKTLVKE